MCKLTNAADKVIEDLVDSGETFTARDVTIEVRDKFPGERIFHYKLRSHINDRMEEVIIDGEYIKEVDLDIDPNREMVFKPADTKVPKSVLTSMAQKFWLNSKVTLPKTVAPRQETKWHTQVNYLHASVPDRDGRGRVCVPKSIAKQLVKPGDIVEVYKQCGNKLVVVPKDRCTLVGLYKAEALLGTYTVDKDNNIRLSHSTLMKIGKAVGSVNIKTTKYYFEIS